MFTEENPLKETPNKFSFFEQAKYPNFTYDKDELNWGDKKKESEHGTKEIHSIIKEVDEDNR